MNGYGSHTFKWVNDQGQAFWVKYHWISNQGVKGLDVKLAERLAGENPDYHIEDLYTAIQEEDYPTWTLYVQIIPYEDYKTYKRSEEHTSELQSRFDLVCRLLLENKNIQQIST